MLLRSSAIIILLVILGTGCKKEPTIEERLVSVGTWEISTLNWMKVTEAVSLDSSDLVGLDIGVRFGTEQNAGTFEFKEEGLGSFDYRLDNGLTRSGSFVWGINEDGTVSVAEISINFLDFIWNLINNPDGDFTFNQELFAFTLTHVGGDEFTLQGGGAVHVIRAGTIINVGQYVYTIDAVLEEP